MGDLVRTTPAARAIGVNRTTLGQWVRQGRVTPAVTTVGGHYRWNVDQLRAEVAEARQRVSHRKAVI